MSAPVVRHGVADYDPEAHIAHVTLEVVHGHDRALVSVALDRPGARGDDAPPARVVCSCGAIDCDHAAAALRFLRPEPALRRTSLAPGWDDPLRSVPGTRVAPAVDAPPRMVLADALDDAITAVVREGPYVTSPTLDDALRRALMAPRVVPLGLERLVGRLRVRIATRDAAGVVTLLAQLARLADVLREDDDATVARWLGREAAPAAPAERVEDVMLLELAREWLAAPQRAGMERRWLLVVDGPLRGTLLREERRRGEPPPSLGPCPRVITAGLAEIDPGDEPRRIHLLQYEVNIAVGEAHLALVTGLARRTFTDLVPDDAQPTLAEPFALLAPTAIIEDGPRGVVAVDEDGHVLRLRAHEPRGAAVLLHARAVHGPPRVLTGRVIHLGGELALAATSAVYGGELLRLV